MIFYFIIFIISISICYLLGSLYISIFFSNEKNNLIKNDFVKTSLSISMGVILLVTLTSVIFTFCKTMYIFPLLVLLIPIFKRNKNLEVKVVNESLFKLKKLLLIFSIAIVVFSFYVLTFYNLQKRPFYDFMFLGKISSGLLKYHTENFYNSYGLFHINSKQMLYHFFELWLNGLISLISKTSETKTLFFVTYPLLSFTTLISSIAIFSSFTSNKILAVFGGFGLLYGSKLFLPISGEFWDLVEVYRGAPVASGSKLLTIYFISFSAIILILNKMEKYGYVLFSFIPIFYPTTIPAFATIAIGLIFFYFYKLYKNKLVNQNRLHYSWIILASIFFIIVFKNIFQFEETTKFELFVYPIKSYIVVFIETFFKIFIEHIVITIVLIYFLFRTKFSILFKPLVLFCFLGLFGAYVFVQLQSKNVPDIN